MVDRSDKDDKFVKDLALKLLRADSEEEVIAILRNTGYWDDDRMWRLYGDKEGNFAQIGNQSSFAEAALVEKVVNSIDARLLCECRLRSIDPESGEAPRNVRDAVARFFEGREAVDDEAGTLANWAKAKRTEQSKYITVAATGGRPTRGQRSKNMCLTVVDQGEGQSARSIGRTILSLNAKNKQRIRFVQGKFNMGGSGALRFCGKHGLQLVITKRHPELAKRERSEDSMAGEWAVTVVRREAPSDRSGEPIHSEFTYLAPRGVQQLPRQGQVLSFSAKTLCVMPHQDEAYAREIEWGTAIKLYEYETNVGQSNIIWPDGLLYALERLMPETPLPIRLHECRGYAGEKERSFETPLAGLVVRLEDGKGDNLEPGFPLSACLRIGGMDMSARIYAFKESKAATYLKDEGVIFAINGQAHGSLPKSIFSRPKAVGLPRLKDSLLVLVDSSSLGAVQREDLFMSSRDRLSKKAIRYEVESEIEHMLHDNPELRRLQQERREQDVETKLSEEKPLEEVIGKVLKASPTLKTLFLRGQRLPKPFPNSSGGKKDGKSGPDSGPEAFKGRRHPTYFKLAEVRYGELYSRNVEAGRRCRIRFETDVENEYFKRSTDRGYFNLDILDAAREVSVPSYSMVLEDGEGFLNMGLPPEVEIGDWFTIKTIVHDPTLQEPFVNLVQLTVLAKQERPRSESKPRRKPGGRGAGNNEAPQGIKLPRVEPVREGDSNWQRYNFTRDTACHVISDPIEVDGHTYLEHVFYINLDNSALLTEMKYSKQDARLLEAKFKYGNVLLGLAMLHGEEGKKDADGPARRNGEERGENDIDDRIREVSKAVAPVLLPMIDQLAGLSEEDLETISVIGEDA